MYDLILLGYRNDLACGRTVAFLRNPPIELAAPVTIHRDTQLPRAIYSDLDHATGLELVAQLRERGAQVTLRSTEPNLEPAQVEATPSRPWRLLIPLLATGALLLFSMPTLRHWLRPAALAPLPAASELPLRVRRQPLRHHDLNREAVDLNAAGDFRAAATSLRAAVDQTTDNQILQANLVTVLRNWAVAEINAGRPEQAVELLREAMKFDRAPSILSLMGIAQQRLGDWHDAEDTLQEAVRLGASDPMAFVALGRVYRQQGDQQGAVEMFQRARESGAAGPDFESMLERLERELDAEWDFVDFSTAHFRFSFEQGENQEAARLVSDVLEDAYFSVGRKLDLYPDTPVDVVLYPSEDFHEVTQTPDWTGGVYDGRIKLPVRGVEGRSELLERTLRHEYGHVLVTKISRGKVPVWLNEGLAIWAEESADGDREDWAYDTIAGRRLFTLEELAPPFTELPADRVQVAYAQSYLAVRAILGDYGERHLLELLRAAGGSGSLATTFERVFSARLADFEAALLRDLSS